MKDKDDEGLCRTIPEKHIPSNCFEVITSLKPPPAGPRVENYQTSSSIDDYPMKMCISKVNDRDSQPKISQYVHVLDSLTPELKTLNKEHQQTVDNITDRNVDSEKLLTSLCNEAKQLQEQISRQKLMPNVSSQI